MFGKIKEGLRGSLAKEEETEVTVVAPFSFDDGYNYPSLYEEADEMLQVALLIYTMTDLRALAKRKNAELLQPERVLTLPLNLGTCLEMIEENLELIKTEIGDADHAMTMSALQSIQARYESSSSTTGWLNPFAQGVEIDVAPSLIAFGDERPDKDLVYAVGVDPIRKRVTVAFRGSVTPTDFLTDANITLNRQDNPIDEDDDKIGIHHGFRVYLLKEQKGKSNKFDEILDIVSDLFQDPERQSTFKLYCTGHSLGGALATLFSFYAAASTDTNIPKPVTCVSVASPRVGDGIFQRAFASLERQGKLRHLRIANDGDPVAIMPKSSSKKLFAMLSPASYIAFKLTDKDFSEKERYRHTGMKLRLRKSGDEKFEIGYSGRAVAKEEETAVTNTKSTSMLSFRQRDLPGVANHFGNVYCDNLEAVKDELAGMMLNDLYQTKAAAAASGSSRNEESAATDDMLTEE